MILTNKEKIILLNKLIQAQNDAVKRYNQLKAQTGQFDNEADQNITLAKLAISSHKNMINRLEVKK